MTDERLFRRLATHGGAADVDPAFDDRLYALLQQEVRRPRRSAQPALLLVAVLLLALALGGAVLVGSGVVELPAVPVLPDSSATPAEPSEVAAASSTPSPSLLPDLVMPGSRSSQPGEYGWTGALGSRAGMHSVVSSADGSYRMTQMVFAVENDCFASGEGPEPVPVTVAGLDATYVEPYDAPGVLFMPERVEGETTGAYALPIGDRTLCVYLTWDPTTTTAELDAAREVVDSIRGQAYGQSGIRIVFTLPQGWDTG